MYRVFVSHGWHDRWIARQMANAISEGAGAEPFIDIFDIQKGDRIEQKIQLELPNCDELVVLLTPWSVRRNWVWTEVGGAWALGKRIVGVLTGLAFKTSRKNTAVWLRLLQPIALVWTSSMLTLRN